MYFKMWVGGGAVLFWKFKPGALLPLEQIASLHPTTVEIYIILYM